MTPEQIQAAEPSALVQFIEACPLEDLIGRLRALALRIGDDRIERRPACVTVLSALVRRLGDVADTATSEPYDIARAWLALDTLAQLSIGYEICRTLPRVASIATDPLVAPPVAAQAGALLDEATRRFPGTTRGVHTYLETRKLDPRTKVN
jgi:hypothetical protein